MRLDYTFGVTAKLSQVIVRCIQSALNLIAPENIIIRNLSVVVVSLFIVYATPN